MPDLAEGRFGLRGLTTAALDRLVAQVREVAEGVARATGTTVEVARPTAGYAHFRDNAVLSGAVARHLGELGIPMTEPEPGVFLGSSDIGNISTTLPAIHPFVAITAADQSDHTPEFAAAAASERGRSVLLAAAKALGRTAVDVLTDPGTAPSAWAEFHRQAAVESE